VLGGHLDEGATGVDRAPRLDVEDPDRVRVQRVGVDVLVLLKIPLPGPPLFRFQKFRRVSQVVA
jgi:hypothetical protein